MSTPVTFNSETSVVDLRRSHSNASSADSTSNKHRPDVQAVKHAVFGPFYYLAILTGLVSPAPRSGEGQTKSKARVLFFVPNIVVGVVLLGNAIYSLTKTSDVSMSINWAYCRCMFFMALHGAISSITMFLFKYSDYFDTFAAKLARAARDDMAILAEKSAVSRLLRVVQVLIVVASMAVYCVDTFVNYDKFVSIPEAAGVPDNDTQFFRKSMFGNQDLFFLDTAIKVYAAFVSGTCLAVYSAASHALCREFESFNKSIKEKIEDKSILKKGAIESVQEQLLLFIETGRFMTENASPVLSFSLISGLFINFYAEFALRSFNGYLGLGEATFSLWHVVGFVFLINASYVAAAFNQLLHETKDMFNSSTQIWADAAGSGANLVAKDVIFIINNQDYGYKLVFPVNHLKTLFHASLPTLPFFADLLSRTRYIPEFILQMYPDSL